MTVTDLQSHTVKADSMFQVNEKLRSDAQEQHWHVNHKMMSIIRLDSLQVDL